MTDIEMLYKAIPDFKCKKGCTECCENHVQFAPEEIKKVQPKSNKEMRCPYLTPEGCSIYEVRPFVCRIYGSSELMPCPHGYGPEKPLSEEDSKQLIHKYLVIKYCEEKH